MQDDNVIPFGKHKGEKLADVMLTDPGWIDWASSQPWFRERFAALFAAIMNGGPRPDTPTPEHNRMQALFLDQNFAFQVYRQFLEPRPLEDMPKPEGMLAKFEGWGWDVLLSHKVAHPAFAIELKPSMGDEYPAVLRRVIHRYCYLHHRVVIVDRFQAEMDYESVKQMFRATNVFLLKLNEVQFPYSNVEF